MAIQFRNGKILFAGGKIAMDPACCCSCCFDSPSWTVDWTAIINGYSTSETWNLNYQQGSTICTISKEKFICNYSDPSFGSTDERMVFNLSWTQGQGWKASVGINYESGLSDPQSSGYDWGVISTESPIACVGHSFVLAIADATPYGFFQGCISELTGNVTFFGS